MSYAVMTGAAQRNGSPDRQTLCRMTDSLRARATRALPEPERRSMAWAQSFKALIEFRGDGGASHDQSRDEGAEESFAPAPGVVHELEEAEIQRQLLLRDTPVWPQPRA